MQTTLPRTALICANSARGYVIKIPSPFAMAASEKTSNRFRMASREELLLMEVMIDRDTFTRELTIGVAETWDDTMREFVRRLRAAFPDRENVPTSYRSIREKINKTLTTFEETDASAAKATGSGERKDARMV